MGVVDCSDHGDSLSQWVGGYSARVHWLRRENCSELGGWPGLRVVNCSVLRNLPQEQVASPLAYRECL